MSPISKELKQKKNKQININNNVILQASQVEKKFQDSVFALAMTDSVHSMVHHETIAAGLQQFLCQVGQT
jgi:hypothetical protein